MYYQHFGFNEPPFRFSFTTAGMYLGESHRECLAAMEWALLHEHCGFMILVGETGTGKTTLLKAIIERRLADLRLAYVTNPKLCFEEIMQVLLAQLGATVNGHGRLALVNALDSIIRAQPKPCRTAIVIDEAQDLSDETLEDLRLLTSRIDAKDQELQLILIGQPEVLNRLSAPHLRQFRERVSTKATLMPLSSDESISYINYRIGAANGNPDIFEAKALRCIVTASVGIPRRINTLCHNALLLAFSKNQKRVTGECAREVVADYASIFRAPILLEMEGPAPCVGRTLSQSKHRLLTATVLTAAVVVGIGSLPIASEHPTDRDAKMEQQSNVGVRHRQMPVTPDGSKEAAFITRAPRPMGESSGVSPSAVVPSLDKLQTIATRALPTPHYSPKVRALQIQSGDTFHGLAAKYLGSTDYTGELIRANPQIADPDLLVPGETIYLPITQDSAVQEW
jgi:type II secretory pathway predicted ATPase ExeA